MATYRTTCIRLPLCVLWPVCLLLSPAAVAQDDDPERSAGEMMAPADDSIQQGLEWLAQRQHDDGSFGSGAYRGNVAVTALAGIALMAGGSTPGRGPYGGQIDAGIDYILSKCQQSGFINDRDSESYGPMYGHGFATLFLAECHGMSKRPELREKLGRAVKLIVNTQNKQGGWRYYPIPSEADLSVTICQVMALRAARNAGLFVPDRTIDRCIDYVKRSQNADGGFMYMLPSGDSRFPISAAGVVTLYSAGIHKGTEITKGLDFLMDFLPAKNVVRRGESYYHYGQYYAVQATWHAGGKYWKQWYPAIRDELLGRQNAEGSWTSTTICGEYATAMALIVLQMPENHLPIFQR